MCYKTIVGFRNNKIKMSDIRETFRFRINMDNIGDISLQIKSRLPEKIQASRETVASSLVQVEDGVSKGLTLDIAVGFFSLVHDPDDRDSTGNPRLRPVLHCYLLDEVPHEARAAYPEELDRRLESATFNVEKSVLAGETLGNALDDYGLVFISRGVAKHRSLGLPLVEAYGHFQERRTMQSFKLKPVGPGVVERAGSVVKTVVEKTGQFRGLLAKQ